MKIEDALEIAAKAMGENGLSDWSLRIGRKKRTLGLCSYDEQVIELSKHFIEMNDASEVRDVVLHEVAHALLGPGTGHGPEWKMMAMRLGANPQACNTSAVTPPARWIGICVHSKQVLHRYRRPKTFNWYCTCDATCKNLLWLNTESGIAMTLNNNLEDRRNMLKYAQQQYPYLVVKMHG